MKPHLGDYKKKEGDSLLHPSGCLLQITPLSMLDCERERERQRGAVRQSALLFHVQAGKQHKSKRERGLAWGSRYSDGSVPLLLCPSFNGQGEQGEIEREGLVPVSAGESEREREKENFPLSIVSLLLLPSFSFSLRVIQQRKGRKKWSCFRCLGKRRLLLMAKSRALPASGKRQSERSNNSCFWGWPLFLKRCHSDYNQNGSSKWSQAGLSWTKWFTLNTSCISCHTGKNWCRWIKGFWSFHIDS